MSGSAATARAGAPSLPAPVAAPAVRVAVVRLAAFAAMALFAAAHWVTLVTSPPFGRTVLVVAVATGTGAVLALLGAPGVRRRLVVALGGRDRLAGGLIVAAAVLVGLAGLALAMGAMGLNLRLLGPRNWDDLFDGLDRGLAGAQTAEWPYSGVDTWVRLTTLLGAPLGLGLAALLAFFPSRRAAPLLSVLALVVLLVVYGSAVTEHDPGAPLLRGMALLVLVGAWLWLPRLGPREALAGAALVLSLGALSLPVAAALDSERPWWNYGAWAWLENDQAITFDWTHRYGPLDWPREGTTLLNVKSDRPQYWKADVLDTFDGVRWVRGPSADVTQRLQGIPDRDSQDRSWDYFEWNRKWDENIRFTVRSLSTNLLVAAGTPYFFEGAGLVSTESDGTTRMAGGRLEQGDSYTVRTYAPNPTIEQMRGAPEGVSNALIQYTAITLPGVAGPAGGVRPALGRDRLRRPAGAGARARGLGVRRHVWDRAAGHRGRADHVRRGPAHRALPESQLQLQRETAPRALPAQRVPVPGQVRLLPAVLRSHGADAADGGHPRPGGRRLRPRLVEPGHGRVPRARPRCPLLGRGLLQRHRLGHVRPDPRRRSRGGAGGRSEPQQRQRRGDQRVALRGRRARPQGGSRRRVDDGAGRGPSAWLLLPLLALAGAGVAAWRTVRRARRLEGEELAGAQLAELRRALARLDWDVPTNTTLLGLERRLGRAAGPAAERYAAALRAHRYDPRSPAGPSLRERRRLRTDLTARTGLRGHLIGLIAIPPGGPRPV